MLDQLSRQLDLYTRWIALTGKGDQVVGMRKDGICRVPVIGGKPQLLIAPEEDVTDGLLTPDGSILICLGASSLSVWDITAIPCRAKLQMPSTLVVGAVSPDGGYLVTGTRTSVLKCRNLLDGKLIAAFQGIGPITDCAIAPDGYTIIAGEDTGRVHLLRLEEIKTSHGPFATGVRRRHAS